MSLYRTQGGETIIKPFSFVHTADLHLGCAQYNLDARREDFNMAFVELVGKTLELKPDFMIIAGDIFEHVRVCDSQRSICGKGGTCYPRRERR